MEQIMKVYLAVFLLLLLLFSAGGIFGLYMDVANAQDFAANMIYEIECSDFDEEILASAFERAEEQSYDLVLELYEVNGSSKLVEEKGQLPESTRKVYLARIELNYPLELGLFDIKRQQAIYGYAR